MTVAYRRYHGTGNDFLVVDPDQSVADRGAFAATACDPDAGVGADGVLFLALEDGEPTRVTMDLWQPDGSTAAMCGNGARCAARWAAERTGESEFVVVTDAGDRRATLDGTDVTVEMGPASFDPADVPLAGDEVLADVAVEGLPVTAVSTGVPHAVAVVPDVADVDLSAVAPAVRHADAFPEGANVTLASPRDDGGYDQRTYERGVEGETAACGTGAVAIAAVLRRRGELDAEWLSVHPPGGELRVRLDADGVGFLHGPTAREERGTLADDGTPGAGE